MFAPDLGEFAYCKGDAVVLSKGVPPVEGDAAGLPIICAPEGCQFIIAWIKVRRMCHKALVFTRYNLET